MIEISEKATRTASILDNKKAEDIIVIRVKEMTVVADYFVIASAGSDAHVKTLSEEVQRKLLEETGEQPIRTEGEKEGRWIVLDYADMLVHIFHREEREFYQLERLWKLEDNYREWEDQPVAE